MLTQVSARSRVASTSRQVRAKTNCQAADKAVAELMHLGVPTDADTLESLWYRFSPQKAVEVLSALIKADLKIRFDRGERPRIADYLERFEALQNDRERVVSLVYEEFCHREERGERPNPDSFCDLYKPWRDSLLSQLRYHDMFSQVAGFAGLARRLPSSGDRFLSFRLGPLLGEGGSARVFLANDESVGDRLVALKVSSDRGKESSINGQLDHGHIVPVWSVTEDPETGLCGLAMPYWPGFSLEHVIRKVNPASRPKRAELLREAAGTLVATDATESPKTSGWNGFPTRGTYVEGVAWVVAVIARAVAHAHSRGVFHRDIKPANVLLTAREGPQLLDFNLSHDPHAVEQAEAALRGGTLPYMAPEQLAAFLDPAGWHGVGTAADIYSLGLLLREFLTGQKPDLPPNSTPAPRAISELMDRRRLGFSSARELNPDIPHALEAILQKCLEYRPEDRYSSARVLGEDLQRFLDRRPLSEAINISKSEKVKNWAYRNRLRRVALALVPIVVLAVIVPKLGLGFVPVKTASDHLQLATLHIKLGEWGKAKTAADQAIKLDPANASAYQARSKISHELGEPTEALRFGKIALDLASKRVGSLSRKEIQTLRDELALLHLNLAAINLSNGALSEAKSGFTQALEYAQDCYTAHAGLGLIAEREGRHAEAFAHYSDAIRDVLATTRTPEPGTLECYYLNRGWSGLHFAQQLQQTHSPEDDACAESLYESTWGDIRLARLAHDQNYKDQSAQFRLAEAEAILGIADIQASRKNFAAALQGYEAARVLLEDALQANGAVGPIRERLDRIERRHKATLGEMAE
jgi:serine/threonine protein kinase